jgi:Sugar-transfer associated ATP-grasp
MAAIFSPGASRQMPNLLRSRDELRAFLLQPEAYPLFGKPVESFQSLGSLALSGCDAQTRELVGTDGRRTGVETLLDAVEKHYSAGYVFQKLLSSHRDLVPAIGPRLATVRIVTIATPTGPKVFRVGWKLPAGGNDADNFWRAGNLLAGLDLETGCVGRVTSGTGFEMKDVLHHPDTGADLIGLPIPNWPDLKAVALEGARLLRHFAIVGWDMASTDQGPVIVEANETPDFTLLQMADRRGVLGEEFSELLARQRRDAADHVKRIKTDLAKL